MKKIYLNLCCLILQLFLTACSGVSQRGALFQANSNLQEGDCASMRINLWFAEGYQELPAQQMAANAFMRAICFEKEGKIQDAMGSYSYVVETFPNSEYAYRSKSKLQMLLTPPKAY